MTVEAILAALVRINVAASLAILLVLFTRPLVLRWLGAKVAYWIWLVVPVAVAASFLPPRGSSWWSRHPRSSRPPASRPVRSHPRLRYRRRPSSRSRRYHRRPFPRSPMLWPSSGFWEPWRCLSVRR